MLIWEGRVVSHAGSNYVVLDKLGRGGMVLVEKVGNPYKRMMLHRRELGRRIPKKRCLP